MFGRGASAAWARAVQASHAMRRRRWNAVCFISIPLSRRSSGIRGSWRRETSGLFPFEQRLKLLHLLRVRDREIVRFSEVGGKIVELEVRVVASVRVCELGALRAGASRNELPFAVPHCQAARMFHHRRAPRARIAE